MVAQIIARDFAVDATDVYVASSSIAKVAKGGGQVAVLAKGPNLPTFGTATVIAVDATYVYWLDYGTFTQGVYNNDGVVVRLKK